MASDLSPLAQSLFPSQNVSSFQTTSDSDKPPAPLQRSALSFQIRSCKCLDLSNADADAISTRTVEQGLDCDSTAGDSDSTSTTRASDGDATFGLVDAGRHCIVTKTQEEKAMEKNVEMLASLQLEMELEAPVQCTGPVKVGLQDFEIMRIVGQGAFGKVFQVRHKKSNAVYALKVMRKDRILQGNHTDYVKSERDLLTAVSHPYIVTLRFSFQTPMKLYLVLDFINGGHLFFNLYREGVFSEDVTRLYTAEIVSAVSYLHSNGIMHRDLKPENVLLDSQGHVRLTDFGLAKGNVEGESTRTNSFIGTMEYMAPEIIQGNGHTKSVDWWSTGILMYEMLCGQPPFRAKSRTLLQQQIISTKVKFPKFLSSNAQSLLKALLTRDPEKRLGSGPDGSEAIRKHPFFKSIDWVKLDERQIESKFKPGVKCCLSVENFDKIWTEQPPEDSPCGTPSSPGPEMLFPGFSYIEPSFLLKQMEDPKPLNTV